MTKNYEKWWPVLENAGAQVGKHEWLADYCEFHARNEAADVNYSATPPLSLLPVAIKVGLMIDTEKCRPVVSATKETDHGVSIEITHEQIGALKNLIGLEMISFMEEKLVQVFGNTINKIVEEEYEKSGRQILRVHMLATSIMTIAEKSMTPVLIIKGNYGIYPFPELEVKIL